MWPVSNFAIGEPVNEATVTVNLQYSFLGIPVTVLDETLDLCKVGGLTCPLEEGTYNMLFSDQIDSDAPSVSS